MAKVLKKIPSKIQFLYNLLYNTNQHFNILSFNALDVYIQRSEKLPIQFSPDILVPPPTRPNAITIRIASMLHILPMIMRLIQL